MSTRKPPVLVNVPSVKGANAVSAEDLTSVRKAAEVIRSKVNADRQRRHELVEGIRDVAMRESLKKGVI